MKRYFLVADADMPKPGQTFGEWHGIDLGSHGTSGVGFHAVVLLEPHVEAPASWSQMPSLIDAATTLQKHGRGHHGKMADVGVAGTHTTLDAAQKLHSVHPKFRP